MQQHSEGHHGASHLPRRITALIMSFFVGLASGTPFLYGVYSPQLIKKVGMTASDSATISLAINIGSGVGGLIGGMIIDHKGVPFSICMGSFFIFVGYTGLHQIYQHEFNVLIVICLFAVCVGFGSISAYFAALKACQANFPSHRGSAGVFPVSAYGLAATVFSVIAANFFEGNTGGLLQFLSIVCGITAFVGSFFVGIFLEDKSDEEEALPDAPRRTPAELTEDYAVEEGSSSRPDLERSDSEQSLTGSFSFWGIGTRTPRTSVSSDVSEVVPLLKSIQNNDSQKTTPKRATFLSGNDSFSTKNSPAASKVNTPSVSKKNSLEFNKVVSKKNSIENLPLKPKKKSKKSPLTIIKDLLTNKIFLIHFLMVGLMAGIGQTYIYSVGFIVNAQINHSPGATISPSQLQAIQVGIISTFSFAGRLFSGVISDFLYRRYHLQRLWLLVLYNSGLAAGQFLTMINNGNLSIISFTSALIGASYGLIFGVYPAIVADFFGTKTFSTTWGLICSGPLLFLYVLNKYFGYIYDAHTDPETGMCFEGNECYKGAVEACFILCFVVLTINSVLLYIHRRK